MSKQPEALQIADALEKNGWIAATPQWCIDAAAELRRLHALNQEWERKAATWLALPEAAKRLEGYRELAQQVAEALNQRDELVRALSPFVLANSSEEFVTLVVRSADITKARAAITKTTESAA